MSKSFSILKYDGKDSSQSDSRAAARDLVARAGAPECTLGTLIALARTALKTHPDIAGDVAWLHAHERRHADDSGALALLTLLLDKSVFSPAQLKRSSKIAAVELDKALRDRSVPDDVKIAMLPLLLLAGCPVDEEAFPGFFQNYEAAAREHSLGFAKSLSDSPASLIEILLAHEFDSGEEGILPAAVSAESASALLTTGHGVAEVNPAGATLMTAALMFRVGAPDFSHERSPEQLDDIHTLATPRARWCLETLANWPGFAMPFRDKSARLAAELASRGIACQAPPASGKFSHCIVSMIDGMGSRTATLFFRTPQGGLDAFNVMLNDEVGVKDAFGHFGSGDELERMFRLNPEYMQFAKAPLSLFRELLADAFALHEELRTAPPGQLFPLMAYLGDAPIKPGKREPNLDAYMLETLPLTPSLVNCPVDLTENPLFGCLYPASDEAYVFCGKHMNKWKIFDIDKITEFVKTIMPLERERLLRRMAINLEVEALAGRASRRDNKAAARLWLGMKENVMPFEAVPFVSMLAGMAAGRITNDIRAGYKNQRAAFEAEECGERGWAPLSITPMDDGFEKLPKAEREAVLTAMMQKLFDDKDLIETITGGKPKSRCNVKSDERAPRLKSNRAAPDRHMYRLVVDIIGYPPTVDEFMQTHPDITRVIEIAGDQTLDKLHLAIFKAFDREDMHAYEFQFSDKPMEPGAPRYTHPQVLANESYSELMHDATATTIDEMGLENGQKFLYWFDFGDDWWHGITVKEIDVTEPRRKYPRVAEKIGISPPQYPEM